MEKVNAIYRVCDLKDSVNGLPRPFGLTKDQIIEVGFKSLTNALSKVDHEITIVGDNISKETIKFLHSLAPKAEFFVSDKPMGNAKSLLSCFEVAKSSSENDLIFFCEDDYFFLPDAFTRMVHFYETYTRFMGDLFYHPTDYPDQYLVNRIKPSLIFSHPQYGTFREVGSTTFTFGCPKKTFNKFYNLLIDCAVRKRVGYGPLGEEVFSPAGADDGRFSEIFAQNKAKCFSPITSSAAHLHVGTLPYLIDWEKLIKG